MQPRAGIGPYFFLYTHRIKAGRGEKSRTTGFLEAPRTHMNFGKATRRSSSAEGIIGLFGKQYCALGSNPSSSRDVRLNQGPAGDSLDIGRQPLYMEPVSVTGLKIREFNPPIRPGNDWASWA